MNAPPIPWEWACSGLYYDTLERLWECHIRLAGRFESHCCSPTDFEQFPDGFDLRITDLDQRAPRRRHIFEVGGCGLEREELGLTVYDWYQIPWPSTRVLLELGRADVGWGGRRNYVASTTIPALDEDLAYTVAYELAPFDAERMATTVVRALYQREER